MKAFYTREGNGGGKRAEEGVREVREVKGEAREAEQESRMPRPAMPATRRLDKACVHYMLMHRCIKCIKCIKYTHPVFDLDCLPKSCLYAVHAEPRRILPGE